MAELERALDAIRVRIDGGDAAGALDACEALLPEQGAVASVHVTRALALGALGRHTEACIAATWAVERAPGSPVAWTTLGDAMLRADQAGAAQSAYGQALARRPGDSAVWARLGDALRRRGLVDRAVTAFERAVELDPALAHGRVGRAEVRSWLGIDDGGVGDARLGASLAPGDSRAHEVLGTALRRVGRWGEALDAFDRARALGARGPVVEAGRIHALLASGRVDDGFAAWAAQAQASPAMAALPGVPPWAGEPPAGCVLALSAAADLGETLSLLRWVGAAAEGGARVVLRAPAGWHDLLRGARGVAALAVPGEPSVGADLQAPLEALPHLLGVTDPPEGPALVPDRARRALWHKVLVAAELRVGVVAHAVPPHAEEHLRSPGIGALEPLAGIPGVRLLTLQPPGAGEPPPTWAEGLGEHLHADPSMVDLVAALGCLDLVVASDGPMAHLAATLGVQTWVLLSAGGGWPWVTGTARRPLHPNVRAFVQPHPGAWTAVIDDVAGALRRYAWNRRER